MRHPIRWLAFLVLAVCVPVLGAAAPAPRTPTTPPAHVTEAEARAWREDLHFLATELPRRHPMLFDGLTPTKLTAARLDSAVQALDARIPTLARHEIIVGMMQVVALVGAGHTSINPFFDPVIGFRTYPLQLHRFADGVYIERAAAPLAALAGARVVQVGARPVDDALRAVASVYGHENDAFERAMGPRYLMMPEVAGALGIAPDMEHLNLVVERDGHRESIVVSPAGPVALHGHEMASPFDHPTWASMRPSNVPAPLWLSHPESPRWVEYLPPDRVLYVSYQSCVPPHSGPGISEFFTYIFALADSVAPERFVLDLRDNLGGDSYYNRQLVLGLIRRTSIDRPGHLFAIIGRGTYSAAQNLVNELERYTNVTFVGEPTGSPPAFFGDHRSVPMPNSGISINISSLWWQTQKPDDHRPSVAPKIFAEPTAAEFRAGVDPVMRALLARLDARSLADQLGDALTAGDTTLAERRLAAWRADTENRFDDGQAETNALGYSLLGSGHADYAAVVFRINARTFDGAANTHDSLGECYAGLGFTEAAIAQYRRALALAPGLASAQEALHRLGATP